MLCNVPTPFSQMQKPVHQCKHAFKGPVHVWVLTQLLYTNILTQSTTKRKCNRWDTPWFPSPVFTHLLQVSLKMKAQTSALYNFLLSWLITHEHRMYRAPLSLSFQLSPIPYTVSTGRHNCTRTDSLPWRIPAAYKWLVTLHNVNLKALI